MWKAGRGYAAEHCDLGPEMTGLGASNRGVASTVDAGRATSRRQRRLGDIPALTGLRFVAALFVALTHALGTVPGFVASDVLAGYLGNLAGMGMTMFFVLSGFVIHYNYREAIESGGPAGYWQFFVARFARLYPLYFALMVASIVEGPYLRLLRHGGPEIVDDFLQAVPYYLTLTQAWAFQIIGNNNLVYQFSSNVAALSWSISAEWFFYLCYPLICLVLVRLRFPFGKAVMAVALSIIAIGAVLLIIDHRPQIDAYALRHYGQVASTEPRSENSLYTWLVYFSPYSRITEFILGVLTCGLYLDFRDKPVNSVERRLGPLASLLALASLAALHALMFEPTRSFPRLTQLHMSFGYALPVAFLIFSAARYGSSVARLLAWRPIVVAGEASYSFYFLHIVVVQSFVAQGLMSWTPGAVAGTWLRIAGALAVSMVAALLSYRLFEMPARQWFRRVLLGRQHGAAFGPITRPLASMSRAFVAAALLGLPLAVIALRPPPPITPVPEGTIDIVEATYGRNCGAEPGNVTHRLAQACSARESCGYDVDFLRTSSPPDGCAKDFRLQWRCSRAGQVHVQEVAPGTRKGEGSVTMDCRERASADLR